MSLYFDKGANRSLSNLDAEGEEKFTDKQDTLVSGENIKTINGVSVLGEGNIEVGEGGTITVNQTYDPTSSYAQSGTAVADAISTRANVGLDNLNANGQMIIDSANGTISNCILEIPQNIKLTLENNVLTLKSGSTIVQTGSTYATTTTTVDKTQSYVGAPDGTFVAFPANADGGFGSLKYLSQVGSGDTLPANGDTYRVFFKTDEKTMYLWSSNGWTSWGVGYPVCLIQVTSGVASFVKDSKGRDIIFNGIGFIGHHIFVYPNVKILVPNEFNEDGSLKSIKYTTNSLYINEISSNRPYYYLSTSGFGKLSGYYEFKKPEDVTNPQTYTLYYFSDGNYSAYYSSGSFIPVERCFVFEAHLSGTTVTDFTIRQPYEGARDLLTDGIEKEVETKQDDVTTLTDYDSTKTQTLKNVNGTLTWVDD